MKKKIGKNGKFERNETQNANFTPKDQKGMI
jgi:hypothetical protein